MEKKMRERPAKVPRDHPEVAVLLKRERSGQGLQVASY